MPRRRDPVKRLTEAATRLRDRAAAAIEGGFVDDDQDFMDRFVDAIEGVNSALNAIAKGKGPIRRRLKR